ncbi:hypothetical protein C7445_101266 [Alicyclobacillus sacchari]|uniref:Uncharacterized protein n=1 Tax=Alicyclobacillus sacchari TaxID=392010 RepID=A0A4R8LWS7_9BACL|nr:hypothetical protein [Alicyclobacillus sacchari]TDY51265.1 hypothetical protein C7445_101266 [Alicyclobacillus sacchari]GMA56554.1 hypothetical protein GCM10025858_10570 [Alicyclobacillus sacchari]
MQYYANVEQTMVAYCFGRPEDLSNTFNHFEHTVDELLHDGELVWTASDSAGLVLRGESWYLWFQHAHEDGRVEGKVYELQDDGAVLARVSEELPWLDADCRMRLLRSLLAKRRGA